MNILCTNSIDVGLKNKIEGLWIDEYVCKTVKDSSFVALLDFGEKTFTSTLYKDSIQGDPDTSFTGRYYISKDSLKLVLDNFYELFYCRVTDSTILLSSRYSIDMYGNKIIDFRSVLWCCSIKKNGLFLKY